MSTDLINEIPKHKKKKDSNKSKSRAKSNHKHAVATCLIEAKENCPHVAEYCTICGKLLDWHTDTEKIGVGYRMLSADEVYAKYEHLPHIKVDSLWVKYLPIEVEDSNV